MVLMPFEAKFHNFFQIFLDFFQVLLSTEVFFLGKWVWAKALGRKQLASEAFAKVTLLFQPNCLKVKKSEKPHKGGA
jgi:hypothetical protein